MNTVVLNLHCVHVCHILKCLRIGVCEDTCSEVLAFSVTYVTDDVHSLCKLSN